ncbi:MAG: hypothetical protein ACJART_003046, partial [Maribacter sp.]
SNSSFLNRTEFKVAYCRNIFWNKGLDFGAEYLLIENKKTENEDKKQTHMSFF